MKYFFDQPERLAALREEAASWLGTPFRAYACVKGADGGVDCARLAYAVYAAIGALPADKEFPVYSMDFTLHSERSPIAEFINSELSTYLLPLPADADPRPGDLLGFKIGRAIHHLSIVIDENAMLQSVKPVGTRLVSLGDTTFTKRRAAVWRVIDTPPLVT